MCGSSAFKIGVTLLFLTSLLIECSTANHVQSKKHHHHHHKATRLMEQGRTFVHHAVKRLAILMPAIFFKLGIAFALLLLIGIIVANNGVIGFLLLVVGLSRVLARLQDNRPTTAYHPTITYTAPPHFAAPHFLDRKDDLYFAKTSSTNYPYTGVKYA